ncbi:hypothetical protein, partial [Mesorhizobium sp. M8A.F.Ca.ET.167.01.1.1]|uniref:hypothetical protein n=1 Tax=Mesorhizobium sp. M8A.F.Ca.ET.167.01.1.1 TaxID=2563961 RepID=UPI001AEE1F32
ADRLVLRSLGCMIAQGYLFSAALQTRDGLAFNAGRLDGSAATDAVFDPPALRSTRSGSAA